MGKNVEQIKKSQYYVTPFENGWKAGERFKYEELAQTLERIRDNGRAEFYEGETAKRIVSYVQELGGILSLEDLKNYHSQWRTPITFNYKNYTISSMPLPSSGGALYRSDTQIDRALQDWAIPSQWGKNMYSS